ncbi:Hypothetical predicted protein, partial [Olea europaea subsp. europaea]
DSANLDVPSPCAPLLALNRNQTEKRLITVWDPAQQSALRTTHYPEEIGHIFDSTQLVNVIRR